MAVEVNSFSFAKLQKYDALLKTYIQAKDDEVKDLVTALENGQVTTNKTDIANLKTAVDNITKDGGALATAKAELEDKIAAVDTKVGDTANLATTAKTNVVAAINEVKQSVSDTQTAGAVTMETPDKVEDTNVLKSYVIKQGGTTVGTINIPKDLVVESGEVVEQEDGKHIVLTLAVSGKKIDIPANDLVDDYVAAAGAASVQLTVTGRTLSAEIVNGAVGTAKIADAAVTTAKVADGNITEAKLSKEVADKLNAPNGVQTVVTGTANGTLSVDGKDVAVKGLADAAYATTESILTSADTTAQSKVDALANGAVATNTAAIKTLNGGETVAGSVAAAVKAAKDEIKTTTDGLDTRVEALETSSSTDGDRITALESDVAELKDWKDGFKIVEVTDEQIESLFA